MLNYECSLPGLGLHSLRYLWSQPKTIYVNKVHDGHECMSIWYTCLDHVAQVEGHYSVPNKDQYW